MVIVVPSLQVVSKPFMVGCEAYYNASDSMIFTGPTPTDATHGSYVDIEPVTGKAFNAVKRVGGSLRVGPSPWWPLRAAILYTHNG